MLKINIGVPKNKYPEQRCIKTSPINSYINLEKINIYSYIKIFSFLGFPRDAIFKPIVDAGVDLYHSFNDVCVTNKKWVVSFESTAPRFLGELQKDSKSGRYKYSKKINSHLKKMARNNCLAIIAISQCTLRMQLNMLESYPKYKRSIMDKLQVLYPPQKLIATETDVKKRNNNIINIVFVGKDFYRKGGAEVVLAFHEALIDGLIDKELFHLTIVGDLEKKYNYAVKTFQDESFFHDKIENIIKNTSNITHFKSLENYSVINIMMNSHVGILPTWADTFGYSVLEFQACGCPVITTDVRALPEINNDQVGWVIPVKKDAEDEILIESAQLKDTARMTIVNGIKLVFKELSENKGIVISKGILSLERIRDMHNADDYNNKLSSIYMKDL